MLVSISGTKSKTLKKTLIEASNIFVDKLLSRRLSRNISLNITIVKSLPNEDLGYCDIISFNSQNKPRDFDIIITTKDQTKQEVISTLAHEMVHVKQFALKELNETHTVWRGTKLNSNVDYWDSPWEVEAREWEDILYNIFKAEYPNGF